jgi:outer membrane protein assembly factor BamD
MPHVRLSLSALLRPSLLLILALAVGTSGCAKLKGVFKDEKENEGVPVAELYTKAQRSVANRNYDAAVRTFRRLVAQYPYGAYTEQALIETAYAQYKMGNNEDAISTIDRFLRTYPTHRNAAYLYYLRGLVNSSRDTVFLQRVWKLDASRRDLATPQQAYNDFKLVVERYPNSRYAADATKRMGELRDLFARHEIETALYYLRRGAWVAAVERAEYMADTYPQSAYDADGIAVKGEAYARLGNTALSDSARDQLRQSAPQHPWLSGDGKWPDYPSNLRKLNPFAGEKSPLDRDRKRREKQDD